METISGPAVLIAHLGYDLTSAKAAVLVGDGAAASSVELRREDGVVIEVAIERSEPVRVARWSEALYERVDFSALREAGRFRISARFDTGTVESEVFAVEADRLVGTVVSDLTAMFRAQRSSGEIERKDAAARLYGDDSGRTVDARGGWLDASGDYSKFLSHLTYTRMMSPQQIPLCAWALLTAGRELRAAHPEFRTSQYPRLRDEGLFGADFLVRFRAPEGYFYTGIFDALTKKLDERVITAPLQDSVRTQRWQAAYRHGGGVAIAALALASTAGAAGDHSQTISLAKQRFPLLFQGGTITINSVEIFGAPRNRSPDAAPDMKMSLAGPPGTPDLPAIENAANIGSLEEIEAAQEAGAMGVGLFRTELLFMRHM
ncbi:MAG: glycoside hydrolase family 9 protein, partial [Actinobacteria bacterium]|nr:glycoside hydrolase family 9 protein [Actinomycetota bacterium]